MTKEAAIDLIMKLPAAYRQTTLDLAMVIADMELPDREAVKEGYALLERYGIHKRRVKAERQEKGRKRAQRQPNDPASAREVQ